MRIGINRYLFQARYGRDDIKPFEGSKAFLFLESEDDDQADPVEAEELATLLLRYQIPIAILNACQSGKQVGSSETSLGSQLMRAGIQVVLAMGYSVSVSAARVMMRTLYKELFAHHDLATAIRQARLELANDKGRLAAFNQQIDLEGWLLPVVYQHQPQQLSTREFTQAESAVFYTRQAANYPDVQTTYGFFGRDLDILQLEKRLLTKRNIVLVQGMGGAGKTTLLKHLGFWWQTTGLVAQVCYFGYDERAWTRQQILVAIAQQLLDPVAYVRDFQPLPLDAQQGMLTRKLRAERHLLILDNLESITGSHLAIQHTLPPEEQVALRRLLVDLVGGRTLVLLGSRGSEAWLAKGTSEENRYVLPGLDPEAASALSERILKEHHTTSYLDDKHLPRLITLLDGFPLALQVVLAKLVRQTPQEVLVALQAGDVSLDQARDSQQKTESILRCIEGSYSNLSPEAQHLLMCLGPFTSVISLRWLEPYTKVLRQQAALAGLPFERWVEVIEEAKQWGLLSPHEFLPEYLHVQPILPYFLHNRLRAEEQTEMKRAVETAFRMLYEGIGYALFNELTSKEPEKRLRGQILTGLNYENLNTALTLALAAQVSILLLYNALAEYLDTTREHQRGLELGQTVLSHLEQYSPELLAGQLGVEFVSVLRDIAERHRHLQEFAAAEASYQKALSLLLQNTSLDAQARKELSASFYHGLGIVAQEQRHWSQAEQYLQQALQIKIEFNDRFALAGTYHNLGMGAQEQHHWSQAEQYLQQALQIFIEFQDHHTQASTYHELGRVAQGQHHWTRARDYFLQAIAIFMIHEDSYRFGIVLRSLARLWQASNDASLPVSVADMLHTTADEVEEVFRKVLTKEEHEAD